MDFHLLLFLRACTRQIQVCKNVEAMHVRSRVNVTRELNPLSPNSDQQQFSPNNVHTLSRDKVVRI